MQQLLENKIFKQLRSLNFTLVILAILIVLSAVSTFSAEGTAFFSSLGFFAIVFLFFVNLTCCTIYRFLRELKKKSNKNFGPDIIHGGLILFIIAALISVYSRMEGQIALVIGESAVLPGGSILTLDEFEYLHYDDGRPKDWISYLTIKDGEDTIHSRYPLRVNHPLKLKNYTLYQVSFGQMQGGLYSVIQAVREPFWLLVLAAFIVCGAGMCITLFVKINRMQKRADYD